MEVECTLEVVVVALSCTVSEDVHWLWLLHFEQDDLEDDSSGEGFEQRASGQGLAAMTRLFDPRMRVLLLHTGGDSKRVPRGCRDSIICLQNSKDYLPWSEDLKVSYRLRSSSISFTNAFQVLILSWLLFTR